MPICAPEKSPLVPALFEALCRAAALRMEVPSFCRLRRCRRGEFCEGRMEPRAIPPHFRGLKAVDVGLVRPPEAARSLLSLDERWPVVSPVDDEDCAPDEGDTTRRHAPGLARGRALIAAIRSSLAARDGAPFPEPVP